MLFSTAGTAGKARLTIAPDGPPGEGSGLQEHIRGETGGRRGPAGRHRAASGGPRRGSGRGRRQGEPERQAVSPTACRSGPPGPGLPIKKERLVLQQTSNYQLSQWDAEDRIQRADFNSDNAKVDTALVEAKTERDALTAAVANCGNCQIWAGSYVGAGIYGSGKETVITFPFSPAFICIYGNRYMAFFVQGVSSYKYLPLGEPSEATVSWSEDKKTISLLASSATSQMNTKDAVYYVVGIGEKQ